MLTRIAGQADEEGASLLLRDHPLTPDRRAMLEAENLPASGPALLDDGEWRSSSAAATAEAEFTVNDCEARLNLRCESSAHATGLDGLRGPIMPPRDGGCYPGRQEARR